MNTHGATTSALAENVARRGYLDEQLYERGDSGSAVRDLQEDLNRLGADPALTEDGIYGPKTEQTVKDYQYRVGVSIDGVVGPVTKSELRTELQQKTSITPLAPNASRNGGDDGSGGGDETGQTSPPQPASASGGFPIQSLLVVGGFGGIGYYLWQNAKQS